jgi:hypothetical protein
LLVFPLERGPPVVNPLLVTPLVDPVTNGVDVYSFNENCGELSVGFWPFFSD